MITDNQVLEFKAFLVEGEKTHATILKYVHEIKLLAVFMGKQEMKKELLLEFRDELQKQFKAATVNVKLCAVNAYLVFIGKDYMRLKLLRIQQRAFIEENRELNQEEYKRLLQAAKEQGNERMYHILMTLSGTGIRVSELCHITVEAVQKRRAEIFMKGKERVILLQKDLSRRLLKYIMKHRIQDGVVFRTKSGKSMDRSNIAHEMKRLCKTARVETGKVFPHNLRHLFAKCYYAIEKNLAHLADVLGHSSIETTRIYVAVSAREHEKILDRMQLLI